MDYKKVALEIMSEVCETNELADDLDLDLVEAGLIDSLSTINIILLIEEKLGTNLQPTDFQKSDITTVNHFIAFLSDMESK